MSSEPSDAKAVRWKVAAWLAVILAVALWMPLELNGHSRPGGGTVTTVRFGVLRPLGVTWDSWPEGVQFRVSEVHWLRLAASCLLTLAGNAAAVWCYRRTRTPTKLDTDRA
jgi:hypothetical protein